MVSNIYVTLEWPVINICLSGINDTKYTFTLVAGLFTGIEVVH